MKKRDLRNDWALFFYITAYIKPYLGILFLATVALAGNLVLLLLRPYLTKQVIDLGFATNDIAVIEYYNVRNDSTSLVMRVTQFPIGNL